MTSITTWVKGVQLWETLASSYNQFKITDVFNISEALEELFHLVFMSISFSI